MKFDVGGVAEMNKQKPWVKDISLRAFRFLVLIPCLVMFTGVALGSLQYGGLGNMVTMFITQSGFNSLSGKFTTCTDQPEGLDYPDSVPQRIKSEPEIKPSTSPIKQSQVATCQTFGEVNPSVYSDGINKLFMNIYILILGGVLLLRVLLHPLVRKSK